jgi:hypothetical protein
MPPVPNPSYPHPPNNPTLSAIEKATNGQSSYNIHMPPEKIAISTFDSDVAARWARASLRFATLQVPAVALKMQQMHGGVATEHRMDDDEKSWRREALTRFHN